MRFQGLFGPAAHAVVIDGGAARGAARGFAVCAWFLPRQEFKHRIVGQQLVVTDGIAHFLVAVLGATADGFFLRRGRVVAARSEHQNLFDQACA